MCGEETRLREYKMGDSLFEWTGAALSMVMLEFMLRPNRWVCEELTSRDREPAASASSSQVQFDSGCQ